MHKSVLLVLALGLSQLLVAQQNVYILANGKPLVQIGIAQQPTPEVMDAAKLLQTTLQQMSGYIVPIVQTDQPRPDSLIWLAPADEELPKSLSGWHFKGIQQLRKTLRPDGFLIAAADRGRILLRSGGRDGAYRAVVHLLEKYAGCRYYAPDAFSAPKGGNIAVPPGCYADHPVNDVRIVNGVLTQNNPEYRRWHGLHDHRALFANGFYVHTFNRLLPWETWFAAHPEYYALLNGKRVIDQLCPSHPEVIDIIIKQLRSEMALQPDKQWWSLSQNDNFTYCHCERCTRIIETEGSAAGPVIALVNQVAAQFPDKTISTLAYQYSRKAPLHLKPASNVQIMLCTIELNRSKSIISDPTSRSFLQDITDWGKICRNIYLWDYTVNFSHHISPFPNLHVLQPNIQFFTQHGAVAQFQQTNASVGHEFSELKTYLISRLLWRPDLNVDSVMTDFLNGYYGAAGPAIRKYIDRMQAEIQRSGEWLDIYGHPTAHAETFLSADNTAYYTQCFNEAAALVAADPVRSARVDVCRLPLQYALMEIGKNDLFGPRGFYNDDKGRFTLKSEMAQMVEQFYGVCIANKVLNINEAGLTPQEYYETSKRFIQVQIAGNKAFRKKITATPPPAAKYSKGDLGILTNGVQGAHDFKAHWLGWEGEDVELVLDLDTLCTPQSVRISTLYDPKSWILHPRFIICYVSTDGLHYREAGINRVAGEQQEEPVTRNFIFKSDFGACRYIKLAVQGTRTLPKWHPSAGGRSWIFIDEVVVH